MAFVKKQPGPDPVDSFKSFLKQEGPLNGAFCFCGEEEYLKQYYLESLRRRVLDAEGGDAFDHIRLSGAGTDTDPFGATLADRVADALAMPPMLCSGKLIELSEPTLRGAGADDLADVLELVRDIQSYPGCVFVLVLSEEELPTLDYRAASSSLYKSIADAVTMVPFHRQTREKLAPWCLRHFKEAGIAADSTTAFALIDRSGREMYTLAGEIRKLCWFALAEGKKTVTPQDVAYLCPLNEESAAFGFSNAVMERNVDALLREYRLASRDKIDEIAVFSQVFGAVLDLFRVRRALEEGLGEGAVAGACRINPYRAGLLIRACRRYTFSELTAICELGADTDYRLKYTMCDKSVELCRFLCAIGKERN